MIRFLQQFEHGKGDYSKSRRRWVEGVSLEELRRKSSSSSSKRKRRPD